MHQKSMNYGIALNLNAFRRQSDSKCHSNKENALQEFRDASRPERAAGVIPSLCVISLEEIECMPFAMY